jgi:hypothetical protein
MLVVTQQTFVSAFRKNIDSFLYQGRNAECQDATGGFGIKTAAERIEKLIEYGGCTHVSTLSREPKVRLQDLIYTTPAGERRLKPRS